MHIYVQLKIKASLAFGKAVLKTEGPALVPPKGLLALVVMFSVMESESYEISHPAGTAAERRMGLGVTSQEDEEEITPVQGSESTGAGGRGPAAEA